MSEIKGKSRHCKVGANWNRQEDKAEYSRGIKMGMVVVENEMS